MNIKFFLFDFGGVIWTPLDDNFVWANRERLARSLEFEDKELMWHYFYGGEEWLLTKTGRWTDAQMWSSLLTPLGLSSETEQASFLKDLFHGVGLKSEMDMLLKELFELYTLGILSNASDVLESLINEQLGISGYFGDIINSHRIRVAKPQVESYKIALDRLHANPDEVFFVDDQQRNILAAEALGIHSHLFTTVENLRGELLSLNLLNE